MFLQACLEKLTITKIIICKKKEFEIEKESSTVGTISCGEIPFTGLPGTKYERTFMAIKPDGVQRNLIGDIIHRMEKKGFILVGIKKWFNQQKILQENIMVI